MSIYIHSIQTINPEHKYDQLNVREFVKSQYPENSVQQKLAHRVYTHSGIKTRYSVISDLKNPEDLYFFDAIEGDQYSFPKTKKRNRIYTEQSKNLLLDVSNETINKSTFTKDQITHLITVSCTGFYAPGPDYYLVKELNLNPKVERLHIGFMGCYAAFTAIKMAKHICVANPEAVVLVADIELCSIHLQMKNNIDTIVANSVFADGAASFIVSNQKADEALEIIDLDTVITSEGEEDMAWTIGNEGFDMKLSTYVPKILKNELGNSIFPFLEKNHIDQSDIDIWGIHPGGKSILEKSKQSLNLIDEHLDISYAILEQYGNMSSVTILFVLKEIITQKKSLKPFPAMAFGPGLTVEMGLFKMH